MLNASDSRALVRNAADQKQVKRAERISKRRGDRLAVSLREVMSTPEGRLVMWEILDAAGIFRSIWDPSSKIHYNAGRQDFGHELLADIHLVDEDLYATMEREMRALARKENAEIDAAHTASADEGAK